MAKENTKAFVSKYEIISNTLINQVDIIYNSKTINVRALWDTGATSSCISHDVVDQLSLVPTGMIEVKTPSGTGQANTYLVDVNLPNNVKIPDLMVCDSEIGAQGIGMLVGMDVINRGDFSVSNYNGKTIFSFRMPSKRNVNYVLEEDMKLSHGTGKRNKSKTTKKSKNKK